MFSRRFAAWVGVGLLSVATIPTLAAPHLARYTAHTKPAAKAPVTKTPAKPAAKPAKAPAKPSAKHESKAVVARKPATPHAAPAKKPAPAKAVAASRPRPKSAAHGRRTARTTTRKGVTHVHSPTSASATAKKLFH
jgi:hypothetical protein